MAEVGAWGMRDLTSWAARAWDGGSCPVCGSGDIEGDSFDAESGQVWQRVQCNGPCADVDRGEELASASASEPPWTEGYDGTWAEVSMLSFATLGDDGSGPVVVMAGSLLDRALDMLAAVRTVDVARVIAALRSEIEAMIGAEAADLEVRRRRLAMWPPDSDFA